MLTIPNGGVLEGSHHHAYEQIHPALTAQPRGYGRC